MGGQGRAEEGALGADFLVDSVQCFGGSCVSLGRCLRVEPPGLQVILGDAAAELVTYAEVEVEDGVSVSQGPALLVQLERTLFVLRDTLRAVIEVSELHHRDRKSVV